MGQVWEIGSPRKRNMPSGTITASSICYPECQFYGTPDLEPEKETKIARLKTLPYNNNIVTVLNTDGDKCTVRHPSYGIMVTTKDKLEDFCFEEEKRKSDQKNITPLNKKTEKKKRSITMKMGNVAKHLFCQTDKIVWDVMSGKTGIVTKDGVTLLVKEGEEYVTERCLVEFEVALPAFAMRQPITAISLGDIILGADGEPLGWVIKKLESSLEVLKPDSRKTIVQAGKVQMLGQSGFMCVKQLFDMSTGTQNPMLPMLLMMQGDKGKIDKNMMMMMAMSGMMGGQAQGTMNPMMMMAMMGGFKNDDDEYEDDEN